MKNNYKTFILQINDDELTQLFRYWNLKPDDSKNANAQTKNCFDSVRGEFFRAQLEKFLVGKKLQSGCTLKITLLQREVEWLYSFYVKEYFYNRTNIYVKQRLAELRKTLGNAADLIFAKVTEALWQNDIYDSCLWDMEAPELDFDMVRSR
jgi:hypothetical protein